MIGFRYTSRFVSAPNTTWLDYITTMPGPETVGFVGVIYKAEALGQSGYIALHSFVQGGACYGHLWTQSDFAGDQQ